MPWLQLPDAAPGQQEDGMRRKQSAVLAVVKTMHTMRTTCIQFCKNYYQRSYVRWAVVTRVITTL